jgi:hypothetical protein
MSQKFNYIYTIIMYIMSTIFQKKYHITHSKTCGFIFSLIVYQILYFTHFPTILAPYYACSESYLRRHSLKAWLFCLGVKA